MSNLKSLEKDKRLIILFGVLFIIFAGIWYSNYREENEFLFMDIPAEEYAPLPEKPEDAGLININTADVYTLDTLPGIGEALAEDIINYRNETKGFESIDEIKDVPGIGDKIFDGIKDRITV